MNDRRTSPPPHSEPRSIGFAVRTSPIRDEGGCLDDFWGYIADLGWRCTPIRSAHLYATRAEAEAVALSPALEAVRSAGNAITVAEVFEVGCEIWTNAGRFLCAARARSTSPAPMISGCKPKGAEMSAEATPTPSASPPRASLPASLSAEEIAHMTRNPDGTIKADTHEVAAGLWIRRDGQVDAQGGGLIMWASDWAALDRLAHTDRRFREVHHDQDWGGTSLHYTPRAP